MISLIKPARIATPKVLEWSFITVSGLLVAGYFSASVSIGALQTAAADIGEKAKPAVVIAEKLSVTLADMDAQITDSSLGNGQSWSRYLADADAAVAAAAQANRAVQDSDPEAEPLRSVQLRLRTYYQLVGGSSVTSPEIFVSNEQLAKTTALWASRAMRQDIIAQAQAAAEIAAQKLIDAFAAFRHAAGVSAAVALTPMALLLAALIATQITITRRTRRLINVPLALATLSVAGFLGWFFYAVETGQAAMAEAKEIAFTDLQTVYRAKMTAYGMKADESMWLFELRKARFEQGRLRAGYAVSFSKAAAELVDVGNVAAYPAAVVEGESFDDPVNHVVLDSARAGLEAAAVLQSIGQMDEAAAKTPQIAGILGVELSHFRPVDEQWTVIRTAVSALLAYLDVDRRIRETALGEGREKAVQLSMNRNDGGAAAAFGRMDAALDRLIAIDDTAFDGRFSIMNDRLKKLPALLVCTLFLTAVFAAWGCWQRYREYR